jgi:hypothetical protein
LAVKSTFVNLILGAAGLCVSGAAQSQQRLLQDTYAPSGPAFQTSDRCFVCHSGTNLRGGVQVTIGSDWRTSVMANSSRDPYWQASVRRESLDHAQSQPAIEDECSTCHMPIARYHSRLAGKPGQVFAHLRAGTQQLADKEAADGVSCSVCHQIAPQNLGTPASFTGGFIVQGPRADGTRPEFGPFDIDPGLRAVMHSSTEGFQPTRGDHIRSSELCATCHTLITKALDTDGKEIGSLPEQVPYQEWLHSDYRNRQTCQDCHMSKVSEPAPIARILSANRADTARHQFTGGNFLLQRLLARYHDDLGASAPVQELTAAADTTEQYLRTRAARLTISQPQLAGRTLSAAVSVQNLGGHKLPTAYPSRRAWLHLQVRDRSGQVVFDSGALHPDGSIEGNDNDRDASAYEPHYRVIRSADEVQIYESILGDSQRRVTTGLLSATGYLKDNRLLPSGFDKATASAQIAVYGDALDDPDFNERGDRVRYEIEVDPAGAPFEVVAELWYQPVGFRWVMNLAHYDALEPRRFVREYASTSGENAIELAESRAHTR